MEHLTCTTLRKRAGREDLLGTGEMLSSSSSAPELLTWAGVIKNCVGSGTLRFLTAGSGEYSMPTTGNAQNLRALHCGITFIGMVSVHNPWLVAQFRA